MSFATMVILPNPVKPPRNGEFGSGLNITAINQMFVAKAQQVAIK